MQRAVDDARLMVLVREHTRSLLERLRHPQCDCAKQMVCDLLSGTREISVQDRFYSQYGQTLPFWYAWRWIRLRAAQGVSPAAGSAWPGIGTRLCKRLEKKTANPNSLVYYAGTHLTQFYKSLKKRATLLPYLVLMSLGPVLHTHQYWLWRSHEVGASVPGRAPPWTPRRQSSVQLEGAQRVS